MSAPPLELMDLRVKQRLVGASILLVLVVLIVPELLSGPKPAVTTTTLLPDPASAPAATRTITVPVNASADGTVSIEPTAPPSAAQPASAVSVGSAASAAMPLENVPPAPSFKAGVEPPSPVPAAQPVGGRAAEVGTDAWTVQLGSFASKPNAEKLVHEVSGKGYAPYVAPIGSGLTLRFRVRLGPFAGRAAAERMLTKLKSQGLPATLEPPSRP
jgi:DedD protein